MAMRRLEAGFCSNYRRVRTRPVKCKLSTVSARGGKQTRFAEAVDSAARGESHTQRRRAENKSSVGRPAPGGLRKADRCHRCTGRARPGGLTKCAETAAKDAKGQRQARPKRPRRRLIRFKALSGSCSSEIDKQRFLRRQGKRPGRARKQLATFHTDFTTWHKALIRNGPWPHQVSGSADARRDRARRPASPASPTGGGKSR